MVPLNIFICIIVAQCLFNLLGIWVLSNETKKKDKVIAKMSQELDDSNAMKRIYKHLWEETKKLLEDKEGEKPTHKTGEENAVN